ncbi:MAG: hypothetical protein QOF76_751, partial [Solirubrobacteraceae bacterium]|nr:hypothetical protein [Solirubrobacteraceae bacterium]
PYADSDNVAVVYMAHMQGERPHVRASRPDVPEALDALVYATLAVDPAERPTAAELATRLEEIERDMSLGVDTPPPRTTGNAATVLNPPTPPPDPPTAKLQQQPTAKRKVPTPIASPGGGGEPPAVAPPATGGGGGRGRMVAALAVLTLVLGAVLVVLLVAGKGDDTGAKGRQASATVTSEPTETSTETGTVTATPTTTETPTATAQPQRTETVTGPNRFAGPADIALLSPTSSQPIAQARQVLGHYLHAYANRDLDEMQNLLAAGITRYGRLADGFCGQHSGRAAVGNDYAYNFSHVADVYYLYGLANADAFEVLQDGSVLTHGLRFSIGDTTPEPIRFLMRGTSLAGVEAYCKD